MDFKGHRLSLTFGRKIAGSRTAHRRLNWLYFLVKKHARWEEVTRLQNQTPKVTRKVPRCFRWAPFHSSRRKREVIHRRLRFPQIF